MQKHLKLITLVLLLVGIVFVWGCGSGEGTYTGQLVNGMANGQGTVIYANGDSYEGEWKDNMFHGQGIYTWAEGHRYEGEFKNDMFHGQGTVTKANGYIIKGRFEFDQFVGYKQEYPQGEAGRPQTIINCYRLKNCTRRNTDQ